MGVVISLLSQLREWGMPTGNRMHFGSGAVLSSTARLSLKAQDSVTGTNLFEFQPNDAVVTGTPSTSRSSFYFNLLEVDDGGAYPEHNRVFGMGFNLSPGGGAVIAGKRAGGISFEGSYLGGNYTEFHYLYVDTAGTQLRPLSMTLVGDVSPAITWYMTATSFDLRNVAGVVHFGVSPTQLQTRGLDFQIKDAAGVNRAFLNLEGSGQFRALTINETASAGSPNGTLWHTYNSTGDIPYHRIINTAAGFPSAQVDFVWTTLNTGAGMWLRAMTAHGIGISGAGAETQTLFLSAANSYIGIGKHAGGAVVNLYANANDTLQIINGALKVGAVWEVFADGTHRDYSFRISDGYTEFASSSAASHAALIKSVSERTDYGMLFAVERAANQSALTGYGIGAFFLNTNYTVTTGVLFGVSNNGVDAIAVLADGTCKLRKLHVLGYAAATTPGSITNRVPFYDVSGVLVGYIPVYNTIT